MDGECGHTRNINLHAKPRTKKPTPCTVRRALSSATGKSHGRGSETSSALAGQTPAPPVAPGHPVRAPFAVKSLWLPPLERWAGPLCPLGWPCGRGGRLAGKGTGQGPWGLRPLCHLIKEKNESETGVSSQQKSSHVMAAPAGDARSASGTWSMLLLLKVCLLLVRSRFDGRFGRMKKTGLRVKGSSALLLCDTGQATYLLWASVLSSVTCQVGVITPGHLIKWAGTRSK